MSRVTSNGQNIVTSLPHSYAMRGPVWALVVVVLGLHLAAAAAPELLWGGHHLSFVPLPYQIALYVLVLVLAVPSLQDATILAFAKSLGRRVRLLRWRFGCAVAAAVVLGIAVFCGLQIQHTIFGDATVRLSELNGASAPVAPWYRGDTVVRFYLHSLFKWLWNPDPAQSFAATSILYGVFFLIAKRRHHTPAGAHSRRSWIAIRRADDIRVRPALLRLHRGIQLNCGSRTTVSVGGRDLQRRFGKAVASGDSPPPPRILSRARPIRWAGTGLRHHLPTWPGSTSGSSLAAKMPVRSHRGQRSGRMGSLPARPSHFGDSAGSVLRAYTVHPALVRAYSILRQREHPRGSPRLDGPLCGDFSVFERPSLRPR